MQEMQEMELAELLEQTIDILADGHQALIDIEARNMGTCPTDCENMFAVRLCPTGCGHIAAKKEIRLAQEALNHFEKMIDALYEIIETTETKKG